MSRIDLHVARGMVGWAFLFGLILGALGVEVLRGLFG